MEILSRFGGGPSRQNKNEIVPASEQEVFFSLLCALMITDFVGYDNSAQNRRASMGHGMFSSLRSDHKCGRRLVTSMRLGTIRWQYSQSSHLAPSVPISRPLVIMPSTGVLRTIPSIRGPLKSARKLPLSTTGDSADVIGNACTPIAFCILCLL